MSGDTKGLTVDGPDITAALAGIEARLRKAGDVMREGIAKVAAQLADTVRPGLQSVAHELAFRAHARTCGERVCDASMVAQHADLDGPCPTCGAEV